MIPTFICLYVMISYNYDKLYIMIIFICNGGYYIVCPSALETFGILICRCITFFHIYYWIIPINTLDYIVKAYFAYNVYIAIIHLSILFFKGRFQLQVSYHQTIRPIIRQEPVNEHMPVLEDDITNVQYKKEMNNPCSICLEDFTENETLSQLPCKHIFHQTCCTNWLQINHSCPLCRRSTIKQTHYGAIV